MKSLFDKHNLNKVGSILRATIIASLFVYVFSISCFGEQNFKKFAFLNYGYYLIYISMALLLLFVVFYMVLFRKTFKINPISVLIPVFVLFAIVGTILFSKKFGEWRSLALLCLTFFCFIYAFRIIKKKYLILYVITSALFIFTIFFLFYYLPDIFNFRELLSGEMRLGAEFDNQNGVAAFASVSLGLSLYLVIKSKDKIRFLFLPCVITSSWVGIATGSRTFVITAYVIAAILFMFIFSKHKVIYFCCLILITAVVFVIINTYFDNRLIKAFETLFGSAQKYDNSTVSRELYFDYGIVLGSRNILFGYGARGFGIVSGVGTYAHNNYAEVLCDFGVVGLILFYLPLIIFFYRAATIKKIDKAFVFTFIIYYFVASFTNVIYYKKMYFLIFSLVFYFCFEEPFNRVLIPKITSLRKIVFTCDSMGSGGAERVIASLANEMQRRGIEVTIIAVADTTLQSFYSLNDGIEYSALVGKNNKRPNSFRRIFLLRRLIKKHKPDIVISFLPNANIYTWLSLIGTKIPYIVSERNNPYVNPVGKLTRFLKRMSFSFSDGAIFQTEDAKLFYPNSVQEKSQIIMNPVEIHSKIIKIKDRKKIVLAVGRLTEQKNYKCLINAFAIFNKKMNFEYRLKIYGDGPLKKELLIYCSKLGIEDKVIFVGNDSHWQENERDDSMYVMSSDYEGMPNSLAESMAIGLPCICTDCPIGGPRELIKDGINGFLVPVGNESKLAEKMIEVAVKLPETFVAENANMVSNFSVEKITDKWLSYICGLQVEVYE